MNTMWRICDVYNPDTSIQKKKRKKVRTNFIQRHKNIAFATDGEL